MPARLPDSSDEPSHTEGAPADQFSYLLSFPDKADGRAASGV